MPSESLPTLVMSKGPASVTKVSPSKSATKAGRNDCPVCGSANTGKATGKFKAVGFRAFPNRRCYVCDTIWAPGYPKWAALVCIVTGVTVFFLKILIDAIGLMAAGPENVNRGILYSFSNAFVIFTFSLLPTLYGLAVLVGIGGKLRILSKGSLTVQQAARARSK
jgi:hypothetical protein